MIVDRSKENKARVLPKLLGSDVELGNFEEGADFATGSGYYASRTLLSAIQGYPEGRRGLFDRYRPQSGATRGGPYGVSGGWSANPQDCGRRFLAENGASAYIDLDHLELCTPEILSAFDLVAAGHGMLRIAQRALCAVNERASNRRIQVLANNTDGLGSSYGSHLSYLISRAAYNDLIHRKPHYLAFLASFQISSILLTGAGKVGAENGRPFAPFQLSARADFFDRIQSLETTFNRGVINTRNEDLAGSASLSDPSAPARLHVIFFDSPLAHGSALFRAGLMQMILSLIERGRINSRLILDNPLWALDCFSHDPTLSATARLIGGEQLNIVELQSAYLDEVRRHAADGVFEGIVPRSGEIIALWEDTLNKFASGDVLSLAPRLDWVLKLMAIERALDENPRLDWASSPEIKMLDHMYSSLDGGLFFTYDAAGFTERLVSSDDIERFAFNPPPDTRAWTRAMLLRRAAEEGVEVDAVDWDRMTFRMRGRHGWPVYRTLEMANPLGFTEAEAGPLFAESDFVRLLDALEDINHASSRHEPETQSDNGGICNALSHSTR